MADGTPVLTTFKVKDSSGNLHPVYPATTAAQVDGIGISGGTITIGSSSITPLTSHQSLSGYVPTSRKVNGSALSSDVTLTTGDLKVASGYAMASSATAVAASDTVTVALGKLEKQIAGKQASGTYLTAASTLDATKLSGTIPSSCYTDTDTHYSASLVIGTSSAATANASSTNTNTYVNVVENSSAHGSIQVTGSNNVTVAASAGKLTISGPTLTSYLTAASTLDATKLSGTIPSSCYTDTNTHYTANIILGASSGATSNASATDPHLVVVENSTRSGSVQIKGSNNVSVSASGGVLTISGPTLTSYLTASSSLDATKLTGTIPSSCYTDTNTHYSASLVLASTNSATSNASTVNASTFLNVIENSSRSGYVQITGSNNVTVAASGGKLTISGPTLTSYAPKASPEFTGTPTAPTASSGTSSTQIATTAFVTAAIASIPGGAMYVMAGTPSGTSVTGFTAAPSTTGLATGGLYFKVEGNV